MNGKPVAFIRIINVLFPIKQDLKLHLSTQTISEMQAILIFASWNYQRKLINIKKK